MIYSVFTTLAASKLRHSHRHFTYLLLWLKHLYLELNVNVIFHFVWIIAGAWLGLLIL